MHSVAGATPSGAREKIAERSSELPQAHSSSGSRRGRRGCRSPPPAQGRPPGAGRTRPVSVQDAKPEPFQRQNMGTQVREMASWTGHRHVEIVLLRVVPWTALRAVRRDLRLRAGVAASVAGAVVRPALDAARARLSAHTQHTQHARHAPAATIGSDHRPQPGRAVCAVLWGCGTVGVLRLP